MMQCACVPNKDETSIDVPCLLHAVWAKTDAAKTWGAQPTAESQPRPKARLLDEQR